MIQWPDFFASNYISRPKELENVSAYEFVMWYEKKTGSIKINKIDEEIGDCNLKGIDFSVIIQDINLSTFKKENIWLCQE